MQLVGHANAVTSASFASNDKRVVTSSEDGSVRLWDLAPRLPVWEDKETGAVAFSRDSSRLMTCSGRVLDARNGKQVANLPTCRKRIVASPAADIVAMDTGRAIEIVDAVSGQTITPPIRYIGFLNDLRFDRSGRRIAIGSGAVKDLKGGLAAIWDIGSSQEIRSIRNDSAIWGVAFHPDGIRVATFAENGQVQWWDTVTGDGEAPFPAHERGARAMAISPDGALIATASTEEVARVWDARSGRKHTDLSGHGQGWINSIAFTREGDLIATGSSNSSARIWDLKSGTEGVRLEGAGGRVLAVEFAPDGSRLAVATGGGISIDTVRVWDVSWLTKVRESELVHRVCTEKLIGDTRRFTDGDMRDPLLLGLAGADPCTRVGPLTFEYWRTIFSAWLPAFDTTYATRKG